MGPLIENLMAFGYDDKNLVALPVSPKKSDTCQIRGDTWFFSSLARKKSVDRVFLQYDWRLPLPALETRDKYFTEVKEEIEKLHKNTGLPVVVVCHSMGNRYIPHTPK